MTQPDISIDPKVLRIGSTICQEICAARKQFTINRRSIKIHHANDAAHLCFSVLGPQASPPARVENNQLNFIDAQNVSCVPPSGLRGTRAGGDACGPRTMIRNTNSLSNIVRPSVRVQLRASVQIETQPLFLFHPARELVPQDSILPAFLLYN